MTLSLVPGPGYWGGTQVIQVDLTKDPAYSMVTADCNGYTAAPDSGLSGMAEGQLCVWVQGASGFTQLNVSNMPASIELPGGSLYLVAPCVNDPMTPSGGPTKVFYGIADEGSGNYNFSGLVVQAYGPQVTSSSAVAIMLSGGKGK